MNIIIVIRHWKYLQEQDLVNSTPYDLIQRFDKIIEENGNVHVVDYVPGNPNRTFEEIVTILFDVLPTCKWCGRLFTKTVSNKKYCSKSVKIMLKKKKIMITSGIIIISIKIQ